VTLAKSLSGAIMPMINTFCVILMVSGLYAVFCVMIWRDSDPDKVLREGVGFRVSGSRLMS